MQVGVGARGQDGGPYGALLLRKAASQSGVGGVRQLTVEALREAPSTLLLVLYLGTRRLMRLSSSYQTSILRNAEKEKQAATFLSFPGFKANMLNNSWETFLLHSHMRACRFWETKAARCCDEHVFVRHRPASTPTRGSAALIAPWLKCKREAAAHTDSLILLDGRAQTSKRSLEAFRYSDQRYIVSA